MGWTSMAYQIEDEHGVTWHVDKGDPAYEHVQNLRKANYTWVILPRQLILDGALPVWIHDGVQSKESMRLIECLGVLSGSQ